MKNFTILILLFYFPLYSQISDKGNNHNEHLESVIEHHTTLEQPYAITYLKSKNDILNDQIIQLKQKIKALEDINSSTIKENERLKDSFKQKETLEKILSLLAIQNTFDINRQNPNTPNKIYNQKLDVSLNDLLIELDDQKPTKELLNIREAIKEYLKSLEQSKNIIPQKVKLYIGYFYPHSIIKYTKNSFQVIVSQSAIDTNKYLPKFKGPKMKYALDSLYIDTNDSLEFYHEFHETQLNIAEIEHKRNKIWKWNLQSLSESETIKFYIKGYNSKDIPLCNKQISIINEYNLWEHVNYFLRTYWIIIFNTTISILIIIKNINEHIEQLSKFWNFIKSKFLKSKP